MTITQGIKLDEITRARLKTLAEKRSRSPHWLMREAIGDYLKREEQYESEKEEDMRRWEEYQMTGNAIDNTVVKAWLKDLASGKDVPCPQ